ncbi:MAG: O-antigen ligase family protein [Crocosphaera sp.]|nr:O-antigen ligase family protein [Crocosphaera sp.]
MTSNYLKNKKSKLALLITLGGILAGILVGILVGFNALYVIALIVVITSLILFFFSFEMTVLSLLIIRSSLDILSDYQIPTAFALGIIALTLMYVTIQLLTNKPVYTDKFWWFLVAWLVTQGLWVILLPLGGLGLGGWALSIAVREWVRLFSWIIIYLLILQLKDKINPHKIVTSLFLGLVIPLTVAFLQILVPSSLLPSILVYENDIFEAGTRINATFGHPNTFTTFTFLFLGLTYWKQQHSKNRKLWLILLGIVAFFFVSTKALVGLMMLATFLFCIFSRNANIINIIGGIILFVFVIGLFASTEFGQERLGSIAQTPLLNPDIDIWKAIMLSKTDGNSFNWRLAQWAYLLGQWQQYPLLGFGLGTGKYISTNGLEPHNEYLRALIEGGIMGLIIFFIFLGGQIIYLFKVMRSSFDNKMKQDLAFTLMAILLGLCVGMITENIWTHTTLFFYWWTILALMSWDWDNNEKSSNH